MGLYDIEKALMAIGKVVTSANPQQALGEVIGGDLSSPEVATVAEKVGAPPIAGAAGGKAPRITATAPVDASAKTDPAAARCMRAFGCELAQGHDGGCVLEAVVEVPERAPRGGASACDR